MLSSNIFFPDRELIILIRNGDRAAYQKVYHHYWKGLFELACRKTGDQDIAKDIVQNVLLSVWERREELSITESMTSFLYGAIKKQVLLHFRSEKIKAEVFQKALSHMQSLATTFDLSAYVNLEKIMSKEVEEMPANMKETFILRCNDQSIREIAQTLNLAEQTVSNNLTEAMKRLRKRLVKEYPERYVTCLAAVFLLINQ
jgi:RNA polymerase sigma factor (sigma-70 family)